ncbi:MAG: hypothetical protein DHS20C10_13040 [marine bacterium B5-7]|nr:MAG: hypothetical protein DHS20C10_13040 [marine bacterium B5-7]
MKRWFWGIVITLLASVTILLTTSLGLRLSVKAAKIFYPTLRITGIHGKLIGPMRLEHITMHEHGININIPRLSLNWRLSLLLIDRMPVTALSLEQATVTFGQETPHQVRGDNTSRSDNNHMRGTLQLSAMFDATQNTLRLSLRSDKLHLGTTHLRHLELSGALHRDNRLELKGQCKSARIGDTRIKHATLNLSGYLAKHTLILTSQVEQQHIQLTAYGRYQKNRYTIKLPPVILSGEPCEHCQLQADILIKHPTKHPDISGSLQLSNGGFSMPQLGIHLKKARATLHLKHSKALTLSMQAQSGAGSVHVKGEANLNDKPISVTLSIQGKAFEVINNVVARCEITPDLALKYQNNTLDLRGKLHIPSATIHPIDFSSTEAPPSDIVYTQVKQKKSTLRINSQIALSLGKDVTLKAHGLSGHLDGHLNITDSPTHGTSGDGELSIRDGSYSVFGQTLTIKTGQLFFNGGPINNPGLNINANKTIKTIPSSAGGIRPIAGKNSNSLSGQQLNINQDSWTVGINVSKSLLKPHIAFYSKPSGLSQTDILSYLVTGQAASQLSQSQGQLLFQAASSLGGEGGTISKLKADLEHRLGIQVSVASDQYYNPSTQSVTQNTSLVLGKYLTPKLYVNYSIGVLEPINTLRMNYSLGRGWNAQTETNTIASGADLLYSFSVK